MRRVVEHALPIEDSSIPWSFRDRILSVAAVSDSALMLWAEQDCDDEGRPVANYGDRLLAIVRTAARVPATWEYAGTALVDFVGAVHVYAAPVEPR